VEQEEGDRAVSIAADEAAADRVREAAAIMPVAEAKEPDEAGGETGLDARGEARKPDARDDKITCPEAFAARASREAEARAARGGPALPEALRLEADRVRNRSRPWFIRHLY